MHVYYLNTVRFTLRGQINELVFENCRTSSERIFEASSTEMLRSLLHDFGFSYFQKDCNSINEL